MSVSTTSGSSAPIASSSEGRSAHAATTSMSGSGSSKRRIPSRTRYVSSPTTTRIIARRLYGAAIDHLGRKPRRRRLGPQIFSRRRSLRQLRSPPVERDDPHREFERASIERLSELGDGYEI